jgi:hypothetical protein
MRQCHFHSIRMEIEIQTSRYASRARYKSWRAQAALFGTGPYGAGLFFEIPFSEIPFSEITFGEVVWSF